MNQRKLFAIALFLILAFSISVPKVRADVSNQKTKITFNQPVEIPGQVLAAGTYWFVLANDGSELDTVQIFSADGSVLYATLYTVPRKQAQASDEPTVTFAERPYSKPQAILAWFYPGLNTGHEFVYPRSEAKELSRDVHQTAPVAPAGDVRGF